ncbi:MAG: hypothetical protein ABIO49_16775 [Dokdonella sp.]
MSKLTHDRVVYKVFPDFKSACSEAKALAMRYGELIDLKPRNSGTALIVSERLLSQLLDQQAIRDQAVVDGSAAKVAVSDSAQSSYQAAMGTSEVAGTPRAVIAARSISMADVKAQLSRDNRGATKERSPSRACKTPSHIPPAYPSIVIGHGGVAAIEVLDEQSRTRKLIIDLQHAYQSAPPDEMTAWLNATLATFGSALVRRVGNVGNLCVSVLEGLGREIIDLKDAVVDRRASSHLEARARARGQSATDFVGACWGQSHDLIAALRRDPAKVGPDVLVAALAFYYAGGGIDGDGGVPDVDISLLGIGAHRSLFTHSILSGAVIETGLFSLYDFLSRTHKHLPLGHDPMWDALHERIGQITTKAAQGASFGLAYHMGVDATFQPAAYHDLPFQASMEVHEAIMGTNAVAEGLDVSKKPEPSGARVYVGGKTPGAKAEKNVIAIGVGAAAAVCGVLIDLYC